MAKRENCQAIVALLEQGTTQSTHSRTLSRFMNGTTHSIRIIART
jgi:hypothetical protein